MVGHSAFYEIFATVVPLFLLLVDKAALRVGLVLTRMGHRFLGVLSMFGLVGVLSAEIEALRVLGGFREDTRALRMFLIGTLVVAMYASVMVRIFEGADEWKAEHPERRRNRPLKAKPD